MADVIETLNGTVIQHGKDSNRIYVMKLADSDVAGTVARLDDLASDKGYTKVIAKVPEWGMEAFEENDYVVEAIVPRFYNGDVDAYFMSKFLARERSIENDPDAIVDVQVAANGRSGDREVAELPDGFSFFVADEEDAEEISSVYRQVFESYPFPIHDTEYILETMRDNVVYFCVHDGSRIVSVASSEMDVKAENVEMTDFATLHDFRGHGFAVFLLDKMEHEMRRRGIKTAYTIARSLSYGMNITFAKMGYEYSGTLTNNTDICGKLESMNIWFKPLCPVSIREPELHAVSRA